MKRSLEGTCGSASPMEITIVRDFMKWILRTRHGTHFVGQLQALLLSCAYSGTSHFITFEKNT